MKTTIFTVGSATYAMKARKFLSKLGIRTKLIKTDGTRTKNGCTFGIEFASAELYEVIMELQKQGIPYELYTEEQQNI